MDGKIILAVVAAAMLLFGCVQDSGNYGAGSNAAGTSPNGMMNNGNSNRTMNGSYRGMMGNRSGYGNGARGMMGNLTQEQRQQLTEQIAQASTDACNGKAEGDACELGAFGRNVSGTCKTSNGTLGCSFGFAGRQGQ